MHPKISKDPFYAELYPDLGDDGIAEAGFFYDTDEELTDPLQSIDLLCTPFSFEGLRDAENPAVLLCTGAFCPPHSGHLEMMRAAKAAVENAGYEVVAGYLSPGHDEYINAKTAAQAIPIHYRLRQLQELITAAAENHWLCADPWEGLFNRVAVNFTDVIIRLEAYLLKWTGRKIPVFYICGADNARFAMTFLKRGHCVVLGRPGYADRFFAYREKLRHCKNVIWAAADNPESSSEIRNQKAFVPDLPKKLFLRMEGHDPREAAVLEQLRPYFSDIEIQHLSDQHKVFEQLDKETVISLDAMLPAANNFEISRIYDLFGSRFLTFGKRPGAKSMQEQVLKIPRDSSYLLFDDDKHSGASLNFAKTFLVEHGIQVNEMHTLTVSKGNDETLDCRDFIIGGAENGLVVKINGELLRVPYIYPYCCPFIRASVSEPMQFSIDIWTVNRDYFKMEGTKLGTMPENWIQLFSLLGFGKNSTMEFICDWHLKRLESFLFV